MATQPGFTGIACDDEGSWSYCEACGHSTTLDRWCLVCRAPVEQDLHDKFDVAWGVEMKEAMANLDIQSKRTT